MTIKSFTTHAAARRYRRQIGGAIICIHCDRQETFIVTPSHMQTKIQSLADDGSCDGSIDLMDLTARGVR